MGRAVTATYTLPIRERRNEEGQAKTQQYSSYYACALNTRLGDTREDEGLHGERHS